MVRPSRVRHGTRGPACVLPSTTPRRRNMRIKWKQNLYEIMNIQIARSNYAMLMERTLPLMAA